jgi:N-acetylmuramic acid 6-phosphate etherase
MGKKSLTESDSNYNDLEKMSVDELLNNINNEDEKIAGAVKKAIPQIKTLIDAILKRMKNGGRLFYVGSGTSGRLGILDASECPPTFGVSADLVIGLISGGDSAIRKAVEYAEDDQDQGWLDLEAYDISENDSVIGIAASGKTPYVIGTLQKANENGLVTGCVTCNAFTELAEVAKYPVEILVGPEFVTGSTRMKAGTAQKMALNMISTSLMIKLGRVEGNKMVDMQLTNKKLEERGTRIIMKELNFSEEKSLQNLKKYGSVRKVLEVYRNKKNT